MNIKIILLIIFLISITGRANWQYKSPMPEGRIGAVAVEYNNKIYIIGGKNNQNNYLNRVDLYDPVNDTWDTTSIAPIHNERTNSTALVYNDSIFVIGGRDNSDVLESVEVYLPAQNNWIEVQDLHEEREGAFSVIFNNIPFVFGGADESGYLEEEVEWWNKNENEWEESTIELYPPRASAFHFMWSDSLFIFGGFYFSPINSSLKLAPDSSWSNGINLSQPRGNGTTSLIDSTAYFIGGETNSGVSDLVEIYNTQLKTLTSGPALPYPRAAHTSATYNGTIYVFGGHGSNPSNVLNSVIEYDTGITSIGEELPDSFPEKFKLLSNYPNPFNGSTVIQFELATGSALNLSVYDSQGQHIVELLNKYLPTGKYDIKWDGSNSLGNKVSSGLYIVLLNLENQVLQSKIMYLK